MSVVIPYSSTNLRGKTESFGCGVGGCCWAGETTPIEIDRLRLLSKSKPLFMLTLFSLTMSFMPLVMLIPSCLAMFSILLLISLGILSSAILLSLAMSVLISMGSPAPSMTKSSWGPTSPGTAVSLLIYLQICGLFKLNNLERFLVVSHDMVVSAFCRDMQSL